MRIKNLIDSKTMLNETAPADCEKVESFNFKHCITPNTKLLIVGTITPPQGQHYFYTAPKNRIYGYIDDAIGTNLKELKSKLDNENTVEQIIEELKANNIAFLDVIEQAIRKKDSCRDSDIVRFCLDYKAFEKLEKNQDIVVVCNSRVAQKCYKIIRAQLSKNNIKLPECVFCSQRSGKKEEWIKYIRDALNNKESE